MAGTDDVKVANTPLSSYSVETLIQSDLSHRQLIVDLGHEQIPVYDYTALTYVAAGNGAGEIETVTYKTGGAAGTTVAVQTLAYDASNRISTVTTVIS